MNVRRCNPKRLAFALLFLPAVAAAQLVPIGSEFQINTGTVGEQSIYYGPRIGAATDGQFVVVWQNYPGYSVFGRRFDSAGVPVGTDVQLRPDGSYKPALAVAPDAAFTVVGPCRTAMTSAFSRGVSTAAVAHWARNSGQQLRDRVPRLPPGSSRWLGELPCCVGEQSTGWPALGRIRPGLRQ